LILASFIGFKYLGLKGLWLDEADGANIIEQPFSQLYKFAIIQAHPILYVYILKLWSMIFGDTEFALRSFSVFCFLLLIIVFYQVALLLFKNKKTALLASVISSTNYFLIWYAKQNKVYTFAVLLSLLSFYFYFKAIKENKISFFVFYGITALLSNYSHPWSLFVFISQIINILIFKKFIKNFKKLFFSQICIGFFSLPSILISFYQGKIGASSWIDPITATTFLESFKFFCFGNFIIYSIFSFVAICSIAYFYKKDQEQKADYEKKFLYFSLFSYLLTPLFLASIISFWRSAYAIGRYEIIVLPPFILLLAKLWSNIKQSLVLLLLILFLFLSAFYNITEEKQKFLNYTANAKSVVQSIINQIKEDDTVIITDLNWPTFYYYLKKSDKRNLQFSLIIYPAELKKHPAWKKYNQNNLDNYKNEASNISEELKKQIKKGQKIFVLYLSNSPVNQYLFESLKQNFSLISQNMIPQPHEPIWADSILVFE